MDYNWPWEITKSVPMADFVGARKKWHKKQRPGAGQKIYRRKKIC